MDNTDIFIIALSLSYAFTSYIIWKIVEKFVEKR